MEKKLLSAEDFTILISRGKAFWNEWAPNNPNVKFDLEKVCIDITDFEGFIFPSAVSFNHTKFTQSISFKDAHFLGQANFQSAVFLNDVNFDNATFDGISFFNHAVFKAKTSFYKTTFIADAHFCETIWELNSHFHDATFRGSASFDDSKINNGINFSRTVFSGSFRLDRCNIEGTADFNSVVFKKNSSFDNTTFSILGSFENTTFHQRANFYSSSFKKESYFARAHFNGSAEFSCMNAGKYCSFAGAKFCSPPELDHATFSDPPDLSGISVELPALKLNKCGTTIKSILKVVGYTDDKDAAARFRKLKELAIAKHDRERELYFFSLELKADRFQFGRPSAGIFATIISSFIGIFYEVLSNFGRSIMLPITWMFFVYWYFRFLLYKPYLQDINLVETCNSDTQGVLLTSFTLSKLFPFVTLPTKLEASIIDCVFGGVINIPIFLIYAQTIISVILLFLMGLGIRNRFKI